MERFNIIIMGDQGCGKSSLLNKFQGKELSRCNTVIVDLVKTVFQYENQTYQFEILDYTGEKRYMSQPNILIRSAKLAIICFDLNSEESLENLQYWIEKAQETKPDIDIFISANKSDLQLTCDTILLQTIKQRYQYRFFFTSAANNQNIQILFQEAFYRVIKSHRCDASVNRGILLSQDFSNDPKKSCNC
ncbi:hypothetical protein pb186bvf_017619 [Paramecium bursaria]